MKFLAVLTPPPDIYHDCSTRKNFWEYNFASVNIPSCGRRNVSKQRESKNNKQCINLDISLELDFLDKREVNSSESRDYMGRSGK